MREIVFDTETTGLSPQDGHRIFEIGLLELVNRLPTGRELHYLINPERELSPDSIRITGMTDADVADKPLFAAIVADILAFIGDSPLVAHNASFDMNFLQHELARLNYPPLANEVVDTLAIAKKVLPGARHSLDALCTRYNIARHAERTVHGALLDARLLAEVYVELTGGLQGDLSLSTASATHTLATYQLCRAPCLPHPTAPEATNHAHWQAKLTKS